MDDETVDLSWQELMKSGTDGTLQDCSVKWGVIR